jgi:hypothetical protein
MILKCLKQIIHPDTLDHFHPELPNIEWTICRKTIYLLLKNGQNAGFLSIFFLIFPKFVEVRRRWTPYWNPSIRGQRLVTGWWIGSLRKQIPGRWVHVGDLLTHLVFKW